MKLKRLTEDYGGGSGKGIFESDIFSVTVWYLNRGIKTSIRCRLLDFSEFNFDGHRDLDSDEKCMEQLTCKEILSIVEVQKEKSFEDGRQSKIKEFKDCFDLY